MGTQAQSRKRAVRLTPEGLEVLRAALLERWRTEPHAGKLTRERRAELLGLSPATAERVLSGQGADRPTLTLAFKNVGLGWSDSYCEPVEKSAPPTAEVVTADPPAPRRPRFGYAHFAFAGVLALLAFGSSRLTSSASPVPSSPHDIQAPIPDPAWVTQISDTLYESKQQYQSGKFEAAMHLSRQAIQMARSHNSRPDLFVALQWTAGYSQALGSFSEAKAYLEEAVSLANTGNQEENRHYAIMQLGEVETRLGDYPAAEGHLTSALQVAKTLESKSGICQISRDLGWLAFKRGDSVTASKWFDDALAATDDLKTPNIVADIKSRQALLLALESQANPASAHLLNDARTQLEEALAYWKDQGHRRWIAYTKKQLGVVEALAGNFTASDKLLTESRKGFKEVGDRVGASQAALLLSKSHTRQALLTSWRSAV